MMMMVMMMMMMMMKEKEEQKKMGKRGRRRSVLHGRPPRGYCSPGFFTFTSTRCSFPTHTHTLTH